MWKKGEAGQQGQLCYDLPDRTHSSALLLSCPRCLRCCLSACAVNFQELDLGKAVGEGSFGQVFLAKYYRAIGEGAALVVGRGGRGAGRLAVCAT